MLETNPQLQLAERYLTETGVSIFLTGKAGTGKTTFLKSMLSKLRKRYVIVAPTGVAAVNAGGVTIHSFFQLPLCPYLPDVPELITEYQMPEGRKQLNRTKANIVRTLELLIIDEISMVRADLLDAIDWKLRQVRHSNRPFGGVQLLMIGDIHQLPPVVTDEEAPYIGKVYPSPFFFHSKALQKLDYITIELQKVYRQQDADFLKLLNHVRDNHMDPETLAVLNSRYRKCDDLPSDEKNPPIRLTTHNIQAEIVNRNHLEALPGKGRTWSAIVDGNFPDSAVPTERELTLKVGAQVMFVKNDPSGSHHYYNGKIGIVKSFDSENETILVESEGDEITVGRVVWENIKYEIDPSDKEIKQRIDGTFTQYPLKLAWAVTIHKAQGLTFDRVIVDAADAFAYGQVYVALSRCRSLEGLQLSSRLSASCTFDNSDVRHFYECQPSEESVLQMFDSQATKYYIDQLCELLGAEGLRIHGEKIGRLFAGPLAKLYPNASKQWSESMDKLNQLAEVSEKFRVQLMRMSQQIGCNTAIVDRASKALAYFRPLYNDLASSMMPLLSLNVENKELAGEMTSYIEKFGEPLELKCYCLNHLSDNIFSVASYQRARTSYILGENNESDNKKQRKERHKKVAETDSIREPALVRRLSDWRKMKCEENSVRPFQILSQKAVNHIANHLPRTLNELAMTPGIGKIKMQAFGEELLQVIKDYCEEKGL